MEGGMCSVAALLRVCLFALLCAGVSCVRGCCVALFRLTEPALNSAQLSPSGAALFTSTNEGRRAATATNRRLSQDRTIVPVVDACTSVIGCRLRVRVPISRSKAAQVRAAWKRDRN
jgi:hypothetical protein